MSIDLGHLSSQAELLDQAAAQALATAAPRLPTGAWATLAEAATAQNPTVTTAAAATLAILSERWVAPALLRLPPEQRLPTHAAFLKRSLPVSASVLPHPPEAHSDAALEDLRKHLDFLVQAGQDVAFLRDTPPADALLSRAWTMAAAVLGSALRHRLAMDLRIVRSPALPALRARMTGCLGSF